LTNKVLLNNLKLRYDMEMMLMIPMLMILLTNLSQIETHLLNSILLLFHWGQDVIYSDTFACIDFEKKIE
jgi:hypothetical protein